MSDQMKQIGMRIQDLREISDYSVEEMADSCGVSVEEYERYERGEKDIPISFLLKLNELICERINLIFKLVNLFCEG